DQYDKEDLHLVHLFMDNLYMNWDIALKLKNLGIKFCGTMRENRGKEIWTFCKDNLENTLAGELVVFQNADRSIEITYWKDHGKDATKFLSNIIENGSLCYAIRKDKGKKSVQIVPTISQVYTQCGMGCVDTFDQNMSTVKLKYKNWSWKRFVFLTILRIIMIDSWIIYKELKNKNISQVSYLEELKLDLVKNWEEYLKTIKMDNQELKRKRNCENVKNCIRKK